MSLAKFRLKMAGLGHSSELTVNGQEIGQHVRAVRFDGAVKDVSRLILELLTDDVEIEGEGVVYVHRDEPTMLGFLENLDVQTLEQEVLRRMEWGSSSVQATVDLLKEWLGGSAQT